MKNLLPSALIAGMIIAAPLAAQESKDFSFGAQLSFMVPIGAFSDIASTGSGVGIFAEKPLSDNFAIRGTVDYMIFGAKIKDNVANDVTRWGILADGIWNFTGHDV
ncbi:MAG: hypothetical protein LBQ86_06155, partial [Holophagales bacterium]|nr:hypothetical protein [Holophagales bacterium]